MSTSFRSLIFRLPIIRVNKTFTPPPLDSRSRVLSRGSEHSVRFVFFFFFSDCVGERLSTCAELVRRWIWIGEDPRQGIVRDE